ERVSRHDRARERTCDEASTYATLCQSHVRTEAEERETVTETAARCAVYARYSSEKQNSLTIDQQIRKCHEYADHHDLRVVAGQVYSDEAISGATDDRGGLRGLLAAAKETPRPFDVILGDDTSRLSRKLLDALRIFEELKF